MPLPKTEKEETRFEFGRNWRRFLNHLNNERISEAQKSLSGMLEVSDLSGKSFLDIGSGSGLFSLAARRLGAKVHSFDYDPLSVACTQEVRRRYFPNDPDWRVEQGSALDGEYIRALGTYDVVYSWGVLHHTGKMWSGLENAAMSVRDGGILFIAIYNDQGWISRYWSWVKKTYNANGVSKVAVTAVHMPYLFGARWLVRLLTNRLKIERGMTLWYDMIDWLGGYPFEVATREQIVDFYTARDFELIGEQLCGRRHGCNEYVFRKLQKTASKSTSEVS
ncbi:class I SAM-dependent methyltransferase [Varunaivibrio sulfuroxidans]|uniref:2-polyprenyl-6-hydroxyphenyl methylase/3-demethylubiquinone-9 3-methyltransferase n=1 Tax=Varunaivibrio sulfuroxidans TaxID=1773489 RepID=A0A4R3JFZ3_9PROT|nr:class I SAM-dependent methyltransferase [Varunaivibrio sulfuroxidans]TCS65069.1 2-polyprenyl-6-hydroxyphenyl methylase/3-demethylubiquinone-9 3-methyltransferase [Varunaivibrio sulfuroxidans]WES29644.1 class I SAM-dependent methyltransferase [Varunaivibrio sulfuroxidans]